MSFVPPSRLANAALSLVSFLGVVLAVLSIFGCDTAPLPPIREADAPATTRMTLQNCAVQVPPIHDRDGRSSEDILKSVKVEDLCKAVTALKNWIDNNPAEKDLQPGDWARIRSVEIYHMPHPDNQTKLHLDADIPRRPRLVGVMMSEMTGAIDFYEVHR